MEAAADHCDCWYRILLRRQRFWQRGNQQRQDSSVPCLQRANLLPRRPSLRALALPIAVQWVFHVGFSSTWFFRTQLTTSQRFSSLQWFSNLFSVSLLVFLHICFRDFCFVGLYITRLTKIVFICYVQVGLAGKSNTVVKALSRDMKRKNSLLLDLWCT